MSEITERLKVAIADRYVIERELGQGGMATVYLAHDVKHDRKVALKVLRPELAALIGAERFLQEIKVTANLQHSHILPLYDSGAAEGFLFYVMPYVEGETLRTRIDREKQLGVDEAVALARGVASALEHAHKQGVVHRDIKPENILLREGDPVVADFGIALAVSHAGGNRLTETGLSIGTPHYMSPEQAMGDRELDARSDIYSLGAVLYEMLTGDPPYQGSTAQAIVARVITEEPRSITLQRRTVPPHVADAVHKALNKLPADRFSSATSFAEALVTPGYVTPTHTRAGTAAVASPRPRVPASTSVALAAIVVLVAIAAYVVGRRSVPEPATRVSQFAVIDSAIGGPCCGPEIALSPDGRMLVSMWRDPSGKQMLAARSLDGLGFRALPGTEGGTSPFFSPDNRWLGFAADGKLRKIALAGGPAITITDVGGAIRNGSWGTNDTIAYARDADDRIYLVSASGGTPRRVSDGPDNDLHRNPTMLPDNRHVIYAVDPGPVAEMRLVVLDLESGAVDTLETPGTMARFAPPNSLLFTGADGSLLVQPFDPHDARPTGPAVALLDGVRITAADGTAQFAVSMAGDLVYQPGTASSSQETLELTDGSSSEVMPLPRAVNMEGVTMAPDGRRVAMFITDPNAPTDIWVLDRDGGTLTRFTTTDAPNSVPVWTTDGRRIAYAASQGGDSQPRAIFWRAADASDEPAPLLAAGRTLLPLQFLDANRRLLVQGMGNSPDIGIATVGDTTIDWLVASPDFAEFNGAVSPDGRWLAYASDRSGDFEVYVQPLAGGGRVQISVGGGLGPRWSPDGKRLYYSSSPSSGRRLINVADLAFGNTVRVQSRSMVMEGQIDLNIVNTNFDVDPTTGKLLVIFFAGGSADDQRSIRWITGWPQIIRDMATAR